jgi:NAD(P)-dependent dehydrogenase (short-subunit alcohol dehydrogenase family)
MVWGASGGIGSGLVRRLTEEGWTVIGVARDPGSITATLSRQVQADVADEASVRGAVEELADAAGTIDLWVYAIGDIASAGVDDMGVEDWNRILDANLTGAYLAAKHSQSLLAEDAHMFFLGAVSERLRLPGLAAYASAKAGIEALAEVLRKEQRKRRVSVVRPKAVATALWDKVPFSLPRGALQPEDVADRIIAAYEEGHRGVLDL